MNRCGVAETTGINTGPAFCAERHTAYRLSLTQESLPGQSYNARAKKVNT